MDAVLIVHRRSGIMNGDARGDGYWCGDRGAGVIDGDDSEVDAVTLVPDRCGEVIGEV